MGYISFVDNQIDTGFGYVFFEGFGDVVVALGQGGDIRNVKDDNTGLRSFVVSTS